MKKNRKLYIIFTILICIFSILIVKKELQNDTFSAIAIGKYILKHGIDFTEHFNITSNLSYHNARYLFNIIIALIYNVFNFTGIYIFVILITSLIGLSIFNIVNKKSKNIYLAFFITIFILLLSRGYFCARAQIISYLLLILEIYFIDELIKTNKKRYIIYTLISSILICNIHTTIWPMTLILFLPFFAEYILSKFIKGKGQLYTENINIKLLTIAFILTLFSGLISPLKLLPYTYMFKTMGGFSKEVINELKVSNVFVMVSMFVSTIMYIYLLVYKKEKVRVSDLFLIIGLYFMGVLSNRNLAFFYLLTYLALSRILLEYLNNKFIKENKDILKIVYICSMVFAFSSVLLIFIIQINKPYVENKKYPIKAVNYILKHEDIKKMRIYNHFNFGAYLEYRGLNVFIDSRSEVYCKEFNDTDILKHWHVANTGLVNYKDVFKYYEITHALVYNKEVINSYIKSDKDYKLIYKDDYFSLYKKK